MGSTERVLLHRVVNLETATPTDLGLEDRRDLQASITGPQEPATCVICGDETERWIRNPVDEEPIGACCQSYCPRYEAWSEKPSGGPDWPSHKSTMKQGKAMGFAKRRAQITGQRTIVALHGPPAPKSCNQDYEGVHGPVLVVHPNGEQEKRKVDGFHVDDLDSSSIRRRNGGHSTGTSTPWPSGSPSNRNPTTSQDSGSKPASRRIGKKMSSHSSQSDKSPWGLVAILVVLGFLFWPLWVLAIVAAVWAHSTG